MGIDYFPVFVRCDQPFHGQIRVDPMQCNISNHSQSSPSIALIGWSEYHNQTRSIARLGVVGRFLALLVQLYHTGCTHNRHNSRFCKHSHKLWQGWSENAWYPRITLGFLNGGRFHAFNFTTCNCNYQDLRCWPYNPWRVFRLRLHRLNWTIWKRTWIAVSLRTVRFRYADEQRILNRVQHLALSHYLLLRRCSDHVYPKIPNMQVVRGNLVPRRRNAWWTPTVGYQSRIRRPCGIYFRFSWWIWLNTWSSETSAKTEDL